MINPIAEHEFISFDGGVKCHGRLLTPEDRSELALADWQAPVKEKGGLIARGAGLSFCAASFAEGVTSVDMTRLKRIQVLEPQAGLVTVEAGVSVGVLLEFLLSNGFYVPVLPGYPTITIGGCIAADVHGKNQCRDGSFIGQVEKFKLHHMDLGEIEVSRQNNGELFDLTLGGCGLTGTVLSATLKVSPVPSRSIDLFVEPIDDIAKLPAMLAARALQSDFIVSWHDFNQTGSRFGKGYLQWGTFVQDAGVHLLQYERNSAIYPIKMELPPQSPLTLTSDNRGFNLPPLLCGHATTGLMNAVYDCKQRLECGPSKRMPVEECYFPNKVFRDMYFHAFGKNGLFEHQIIVPTEGFDEYIERIRWWLSQNDLPIAIASSKMFEGEKHLLRFSGSGICFALDFPRCDAGRRFLEFLDDATIKLGGIPNVFKDSRLPRKVIEATYPQYQEFKNRLLTFDPKRRYQSELSQRLGL